MKGGRRERKVGMFVVKRGERGWLPFDCSRGGESMVTAKGEI